MIDLTQFEVISPDLVVGERQKYPKSFGSLSDIHRVRRLLKSKGLKRDEYLQPYGDADTHFFCIKKGHHFKGDLDYYTSENNKDGCPICEKKKAVRKNLRKRGGSQQLIPVKVMQERLKSVKAEIADESSYVNSVSPVKLRCLVCERVWIISSLNSIFSTYRYRSKKKDFKKYACVKCSSEQYTLPLKEVNRRLKHRNVKALNFTKSSEPMTLQCLACDLVFEVKRAGNQIKREAKRNPCPRCKEEKKGEK